MRRDVIDPKVGEKFELNGINAICKEDTSEMIIPCVSCCFYKSGQCYKIACMRTQRSDGKEVHFVKVEDNEKTN